MHIKPTLNKKHQNEAELLQPSSPPEVLATFSHLFHLMHYDFCSSTFLKAAQCFTLVNFHRGEGCPFLQFLWPMQQL